MLLTDAVVGLTDDRWLAVSFALIALVVTCGFHIGRNL